jgi:hypothetical protein
MMDKTEITSPMKVKDRKSLDRRCVDCGDHASNYVTTSRGVVRYCDKHMKRAAKKMLEHLKYKKKIGCIKNGGYEDKK